MISPLSARTRLHVVCGGFALGWMVLGITSTATAQQPWEYQGFLSINGGYQVTTSDFTDNTTFTLFVEEGDFDATYEAETGFVFDGAGGVRVWRNLAIGGGVSIFDTNSSATVAARLPHPFHFDRHRLVDGTASELTRREIGIHVQATWMVPVSDQLDIGIFGGPTFFIVDQDLATEVEFTHAFPFDTASFTGVTTSSESESGIGFNVGIDVGYYFSPTLGVGGMARFTRGTVDFISVDGGSASATVGGLNVGGGLRVRF